MRVAVVDRSPEVREAIAQLLRGRARVVEAASLAELVRLEEPAEVVVADFAACAGACRGEVEALRRRWPGVQLVVATPGDEAEYAAAAAALAADGWVPKPRLGLLLPQVLARLGKSLATAR
jgi:DNA-binding NarL/FixJ family response regulator